LKIKIFLIVDRGIYMENEVELCRIIHKAVTSPFAQSC